MRVLHINSTSHIGGAARAMQRLHDSLIRKNHESQFLVGRSKSPENPDVHLIWDEITLHQSKKNRILSRAGNEFEKYFGINSWANRPAKYLADSDIIQWAEIIDLRNLFGGFFNLWGLPSISKQKPVFWRLPDMWALTGHCAYPYDCERWMRGCHNCPLLKPEGRIKVEPKPTALDGTRRIWRAKRDIYAQSSLHVIVNSHWMGKQVEKSILKDALSINVISNGVDLDIYKPIDKKEARRQLGLPAEENILLWAAGGIGNYRKGYHIALKALELIQDAQVLKLTLLTMGGKEGWSAPEPISRLHHYGYIRDPKQQALIFSAADAFLCTSLADSQPQTVLEALACGTPVIAFDIGPMTELIVNGKTGYIVRWPNPEALSRGIMEVFSTEQYLSNMRSDCRHQAEQRFNLDQQTEKYIRLYESVLPSHNIDPGLKINQLAN